VQIKSESGAAIIDEVDTVSFILIVIACYFNLTSNPYQ
jgi:hypothetical protein